MFQLRDIRVLTSFSSLLSFREVSGVFTRGLAISWAFNQVLFTRARPYLCSSDIFASPRGAQWRYPSTIDEERGFRRGMSCPRSEGQTPQTSGSLVLGSPCASSGQDGAFCSLSINKWWEGQLQRTLDFCISWGSLQGFYSWGTFLFFLFPSFFFYFTAWAELYVFWTWAFSIWDSSCQLLIFIVVCWLCCIVSERSSVIEWIISLFDSLNLFFILFWVSYDSFLFVCYS